MKRATQPVNLFDYESLARRRLSRMASNYIAGAAADEITLRRNRERFEGILLKPRVLVDVSRIDTRLELFGQKMDFPILLAPAAYQKLFHREGECAVARGAGAAGATFVVSSLATCTIEEVGRAAAGPLWFQLYVQRDRKFTRDLIQRAVSAGCRALCVTVDSPVIGMRNREMRDGFRPPASVEFANLRPLGTKTARAGHVFQGGIYSTVTDPTLTWRGVEWICSVSKVPVILKGILTQEDARLAVEHGAAGIVVSNHGGRNLDTTPATIEALPGVAEAVSARIPVLLDGGVRRGTDVVKALALGAKAVLIGRPYLWALAARGARGVEHALKTLQLELQAAMALCGTPTLKSINGKVLWPGCSPAGEQSSRGSGNWSRKGGPRAHQGGEDPGPGG